MCGCLACVFFHLETWPTTQPRHVPWPGIEPVALWFAGRHSIHWATPARALSCFLIHISFTSALNFRIFLFLPPYVWGLFCFSLSNILRCTVRLLIYDLFSFSMYAWTARNFPPALLCMHLNFGVLCFPYNLPQSILIGPVISAFSSWFLEVCYLIYFYMWIFHFPSVMALWFYFVNTFTHPLLV